MVEQMNRQWSSRRNEQEKPIRLSLADFTVLVREHITELAQARDQVQRIYEVFSDQGDIWLDECDNLLTSLRTASASLCSLRKLLEARDNLPSLIISLCPQLIADLCTVEACIQRLIQLGRIFRPICRSASNEAIKQHYVIIRELEALLQANEDIVCGVQFVFDKIRFLERCQAI